jgi:hypothetical protein
MTIGVRFRRGFPVRGARSAAPALFDTAGLSGVSAFATLRPLTPTAAAISLIRYDRLRDARHRHETIQPDVASLSGARQ